MNTKHTPEPWKTSQWESEDTGEVHVYVESDRAPSLGSDARSIAAMTGTYYTRRSNPDRQSEIDTNVANASRIVASVNACAGIPTEALESGVVAELRKAVQSLLSAMDAVWGHDGDVFGIAHNDAVDADAFARAVLAKLNPE